MTLYVLKNNKQVETIIIHGALFIKNRYRHCEQALLRGYRCHSRFRGNDNKEHLLIHATMPCERLKRAWQSIKIIKKC
ncbi:MAG: hypothetical protein O7C68_01845 [Rickettsia endosymbiont of Ixodes ricinus]|uniref:Uncharacterized protein n=1 Tax=Rickettsia helvetica TaxID=35789 RepID=A0ABM9NCB6_RICHE|nr:hypothetical protein [Rickettsia helvetica]MCZ6884444.1 hypothetical protein [Rickettsia endosymbiont of Ixodes ricinus]MCZ6896394.1 hypothetical protein [Rickettsia endosymbiont of Ixodes ricinus]